MSIKFSISTIAVAALLTLTNSAIASAEAYKTSAGQVVITGLNAKQSYPLQGTTAKNKPVKRQNASANGCGEILIRNGAKYKEIVVGTEKIDPATLTTKVHANCKPKKTAVAPKKKGAAMAPATTAAPAATTTPATTMPAASPAAK
jgi:hypothetical protein